MSVKKLCRLLHNSVATSCTTNYYYYTHLTALCPGLPRWAGTRKVQPIWILLKQVTVSGSGISWTICKSAPRSRQITTPAPHHSDFLQAGCPSCRPTNSIKALKYNKSRTNWRNVCPITQSTHAAAAGLMLCAQQQEPSVDSCTADTKQEQRVNAGSATLSVYVGSWTQTSVDTERTGRQLLWSIILLLPTLLNDICRHREDWSSASVVNHTIVTDPTQWHLSTHERTGRRLLWSIILLLPTLLNDICRYREDWSSASVVNHTIVTDPTQWHMSIQRGLVVGFCGQSYYCYRPYYLTARFRTPSSYVVSDELVLRSITSTNGKCVVPIGAGASSSSGVTCHRTVDDHQTCCWEVASWSSCCMADTLSPELSALSASTRQHKSLLDKVKGWISTIK